MAEADSTSRPTNDAYTGMLAIALLALIGASVLLYLDYNQYGDRNPPSPKKASEAPKQETPQAPTPKVEPQPMPDDKKDDTKKDDEKKDDTKKDDGKGAAP
jgi:hypothetical protein